MQLLTEDGRWLSEDEYRQRYIAGLHDTIILEADEKKQPYGDVAYADPGYQSDKKKRYPINTEEHIRAAWNYINKGKNSGQYSASQVKAIKGRIIGAWKRVIDKSGPPSASEAERVELDSCIEEGIVSDHFASKDGKLKCKTCGETVPHAKAAAAHYASKHEKNEAWITTKDGRRIQIGDSGSAGGRNSAQGVAAAHQAKIAAQDKKMPDAIRGVMSPASKTSTLVVKQHGDPTTAGDAKGWKYKRPPSSKDVSHIHWQPK